MNWLFFSLVTALLWGIGQIIIKKGFENLTPLTTNLLSVVAVFIFWIPFSLYRGVSFELIPNIFELTIVIAASYFVFYYALEKGEVTLTGTVLATYPLITVVLSQFMIGERISTIQSAAIFIIITGAVLISMPSKKISKKIIGEQWLAWAICGAIIVGVGDFLAKIAITQTDVNTYLFTLALSYLPVAGIVWFVDRKGRTLPQFSQAKFLPTFIGVAMMEIGMISFTIALERGLASLVVPVSSVYAAITAVLGVVFLKDRLAKVHVAGIAITVAGILLIGIGH